jgi:hypothetical protein
VTTLDSMILVGAILGDELIEGGNSLLLISVNFVFIPLSVNLKITLLLELNNPSLIESDISILQFFMILYIINIIL